MLLLLLLNIASIHAGAVQKAKQQLTTLGNNLLGKNTHKIVQGRRKAQVLLGKTKKKVVNAEQAVVGRVVRFRPGQWRIFARNFKVYKKELDSVPLPNRKLFTLSFYLKEIQSGRLTPSNYQKIMKQEQKMLKKRLQLVQEKLTQQPTNIAALKEQKSLKRLLKLNAKALENIEDESKLVDYLKKQVEKELDNMPKEYKTALGIDHWFDKFEFEKLLNKNPEALHNVLRLPSSIEMLQIKKVQLELKDPQSLEKLKEIAKVWSGEIGSKDNSLRIRYDNLKHHDNAATYQAELLKIINKQTKTMEVNARLKAQPEWKPLATVGLAVGAGAAVVSVAGKSSNSTDGTAEPEALAQGEVQDPALAGPKVEQMDLSKLQGQPAQASEQVLSTQPKADPNAQTPNEELAAIEGGAKSAQTSEQILSTQPKADPNAQTLNEELAALEGGAKTAQASEKILSTQPKANPTEEVAALEGQPAAKPAGFEGDPCFTPGGQQGICSTYSNCYGQTKKQFQFAGACPATGNNIRCCVPQELKSDELLEVPATQESEPSPDDASKEPESPLPTVPLVKRGLMARLRRQ